MQVLEVIESAQSGHAMANLAAAFGVSEEQVRAAAGVALPELAHALERNTLSRGGLADLVRALGDGHHEAILESPRAWADPRVVADGKAILAHILGSEHRARILAAKAANASGLGGGLMEALLPILAQLLMGAIARYMKGGLGDILSRLPIPGGGGGSVRIPGGRGSDDAPSHETGGTMPDTRGGGGFELPRMDIPPGGGFPLPPMPPAGDSEGPSRMPLPERQGRGGFELPWPKGGGGGRSPMEDWGGRSSESPTGGSSGGFGLPRIELPREGGYPLPPIPAEPHGGRDDGRQTGGDPPGGGPLPFPLPGPGGNNPYGDLSDILRRGAGGQSTVGGGGLWSIVRSLLGSALGFGGRGFIGWALRLLVMRWGWTILRRLLFRR
jgi:hypothetical protein